MTSLVRRSAGPLARWAPLREFEDLYDRMGRLVQTSFGELADAAWTPFADISETDDAYLVEIDLPGVKKDDISADVAGNELVVSGELEERERVGLLRRRTRRVGRFEYRAMLPGEVDAENVAATLADGVLTVRVPKSDESRRRRIEIKRG